MKERKTTATTERIDGRRMHSTPTACVQFLRRSFKSTTQTQMWVIILTLVVATIIMSILVIINTKDHNSQDERYNTLVGKYNILAKKYDMLDKKYDSLLADQLNTTSDDSEPDIVDASSTNNASNENISIAPLDNSPQSIYADIADEKLKGYMEATINRIGEDKTEMHGIDISHWQQNRFDELLERDDDFVIVKVAAGTEISYDWAKLADDVIERDKLVGFYFFTNKVTVDAYPDAKEYAAWCAEQIKDYIGYGIIALDHEQDATLSPEWCLTWLEEFQRITGVKPVFYTNRGAISKNANNTTLQEIRNKSFALWVAEYDTESFIPAVWEEDKVFIHQKTSNNGELDEDIAYASPIGWWKIAMATAS